LLKKMKLDYDNIFVTGSNGWLGRQLIKNIFINSDKSLEIVKKKDMRLFAMIHPNESGEYLTDISKKIKVVKCDITNAEDVKDALSSISGNSLLVHTAGIIHPKRVKNFYEVNVEGTKNIVNRAQKNKINKIIVISSNSPTGCNNNQNLPFDESAKYSPYMHYGKSKMKMELYLKELMKSGLDITIIRPPWFYGENMPERQKLFYDMVRTGKFPFVGNGENIRSVANVNNIVQGILLAAILKISKGQTYWIADEKNLSMNEIVDTIQKVLTEEFNLSCKKNRIYLPYFVGQIAQFIDYFIQSLGLYNQKIHVLSEMNKNIICDITKAKTELGYCPKVNYYDGTKDAYRDF